MPSPSDRPDIEIGAAMRARKLRFKTAPKTDVRVTGGPDPVSERTNLPDQVEPGVTYRDVEVRWHAHARVVADRADEVVRKTNGRNEP